MAPRDEEFDDYDLMDDEYGEIPELMVSGTKRQEEITAWLADSPLAEPLKGGSRSDFLVREGAPIRMQDGPVVEIISWLESEGFDETLMVSGYTVSTGLDRRGTGDMMVFRKRQVLEAPFSLEDSSDFISDTEEYEEDGSPYKTVQV